MEEIAVKLKKEIERIETDSSWNSFYQVIRAESSKHDFASVEAKAPANRLLNRYRDVSPYDHSRVVLQNGPCDYINASFVKVEKAGRNYILTQGALPQTSGHFWLMVWEQKSKAILMLNKVIEKNQIKCHQYWPVGTKSGDSDVMEFPDVGLRVHLTSENETRHFIVRTLVIEEVSTESRREVLQLHYTTWPDFGVPSTPRAFLHFLQVVRDSDVLSPKCPVVVHCSAGIGRSGTFCLVDSCLLMMEQGLEVNVKEMLLEMRRYRTGLIQTADQLRFSYLAILEGCQQLADGNKKFLPDLAEENGVNGMAEESLIPLPPARTSSVPTEEQYRRIIQIMDRPLPPVPDSSSSSEEDSSEDDIDDDEEEEDESTSTSYGLFDNVNQTNSITEERKSSISEVENLCEDSERPSEINLETNNIVEESQSNSLLHKASNGLEENELRRRMKNDATREKILEIRAKQKESETYQGFYRSFTRNRFFFCAVGLSAVAIYLYTRTNSA